MLWIAQTTKRDFKTTSLRSGEMLPPEDIYISFDPIFLVWEITFQQQNVF